MLAYMMMHYRRLLRELRCEARGPTHVRCSLQVAGTSVQGGSSQIQGRRVGNSGRADTFKRCARCLLPTLAGPVRQGSPLLKYQQRVLAAILHVRTQRAGGTQYLTIRRGRLVAVLREHLAAYVYTQSTLVYAYEQLALTANQGVGTNSANGSLGRAWERASLRYPRRRSAAAEISSARGQSTVGCARLRLLSHVDSDRLTWRDSGPRGECSDPDLLATAHRLTVCRLSGVVWICVNPALHPHARQLQLCWTHTNVWPIVSPESFSEQQQLQSVLDIHQCVCQRRALNYHQSSISTSTARWLQRALDTHHVCANSKR